MKFMPRFPVVAVIGENPGLPVETVRPVVLFGCKREHRQFRSFLCADVAEAALVADTDQVRERVIRSVAVAPTLIDGIDQKV